MKTPSVVSLALASCIAAAPTILSSSVTKQPACAYPIGRSGSNAKVSGRVFDIDGKVEYFAGMLIPLPLYPD